MGNRLHDGSGGGRSRRGGEATNGIGITWNHVAPDGESVDRVGAQRISLVLSGLSMPMKPAAFRRARPAALWQKPTGTAPSLRRSSVRWCHKRWRSRTRKTDGRDVSRGAG